MRKKSFKISMLYFMLSVLLILNSTVSTMAFSAKDIVGHWAQETLESWLMEGWVTGYPNGDFRPYRDITRAEFFTLINSSFGFVEEVDIDYVDVSEGDWFASAVRKANAAAYVDGYPDGTIKPNHSITRQEAAIIITRLKNLNHNPEFAQVFTDNETIAEWSKGQIGAVAEAGFMKGYPMTVHLVHPHLYLDL